MAINDGKKNIFGLSKKNEKIGIFWLIAPICSLVFILLLYVVVIHFLNSNGISNESLFRQLVNIILGFIAIFLIFFIFASIAISIVYLNKKILPDDQYDKRSGNGRSLETPNEISGWNWGAAFLNWIWGSCNSVWLSFSIFIPVMNLFWWVVLGINGNKWAWQNNKWESIEKFKKIQKKWNIWGIIFFGIDLVITILVLFGKIV